MADDAVMRRAWEVEMGAKSRAGSGGSVVALMVWALLIFSGGQGRADELPVPNVADLPRVDRDRPPSEQEANTAAYILKTSPHATLGDAYVIVTDQTDEVCVGALERLARFRGGSIIHLDDLGALRTSKAQREQLIAELVAAKPRFVAIAPKPQSVTENMLLGMWTVLGSLGDDQRVAVFPGILAAGNSTALGALVDRSIHYQPRTAEELRPFVMGQVLGPLPFGMRSLQKVRMMRNYFSGFGCNVHSLLVLADTALARGVTIAPVADEWQVSMNGPGQFVRDLPAGALSSLDRASLLVMFGHGSPGTECSLDLSCFRDVTMTDEIVMSGDCDSASPANGESFAMLAIDHGADVFYGHMRNNAGFPHLFPVLQSWTEGATVGEAYQRLINGLIDYEGISPGDLSSDDNIPGQSRVGDGNNFLYVVIGDPALRPMARLSAGGK
jgi:hypothetical protein